MTEATTTALPPAGVFDLLADDDPPSVPPVKVASGTAGEGVKMPGDRAVDLATLDERRVRLEYPPPKPVPLFKLNGQQITTAGNLTVISAQAKAGKTATVGAMLAALLVAEMGSEEQGGPWEDADCLGFEAARMNGKALIYFDTEQSPYDSWLNLSRAAKRAGVGEIPDNVFAYRLLDVGTVSRKALLGVEMARRAVDCGGVHAVIVDGAADLCLSVNDETEAIGLVDDFIRLAVRYDCPIIVILHENPGSYDGKTRGHLGSQLERKAESNVRLVKGADGVTEVFAERCRNASIPKGRGVCFEWSDDAGMHVRAERVSVDKAGAKKEAAEEDAAEAFRGEVGAVRYGDLKTLVAERLGVAPATAERRIKSWKKLGILKEYGDGYIRA